MQNDSIGKWTETIGGSCTLNIMLYVAKLTDYCSEHEWEVRRRNELE